MYNSKTENTHAQSACNEINKTVAKTHAAIETTLKPTKNALAKSFLEQYGNNYTMEQLADFESAAVDRLANAAAAHRKAADSLAAATLKLRNAIKPHLVKYWTEERLCRLNALKAAKAAHHAALLNLRATNKAAAYLRQNSGIFAKPLSEENILFFAAWVVYKKAADFNGSVQIAKAYARRDRQIAKALEIIAEYAATLEHGTIAQQAKAWEKVCRCKVRTSATIAAAENAGKRGYYAMKRATACKRSAQKRLDEFSKTGFILLDGTKECDDIIMEVVTAAYSNGLLGMEYKDAAAALYRAANRTIYNAYASNAAATAALGRSFDVGHNNEDGEGEAVKLAAAATMATIDRHDESTDNDSIRLLYETVVSLFDEKWSDEVWVAFALLSANNTASYAARCVDMPRQTLIDKLNAARDEARAAMPEAVEYLHEGKQYADFWLKVEA